MKKLNYIALMFVLCPGLLLASRFPEYRFTEGQTLEYESPDKSNDVQMYVLDVYPNHAAHILYENPIYQDLGDFFISIDGKPREGAEDFLLVPSDYFPMLPTSNAASIGSTDYSGFELGYNFSLQELSQDGSANLSANITWPDYQVWGGGQTNTYQFDGTSHLVTQTVSTYVNPGFPTTTITQNLVAQGQLDSNDLHQLREDSKLALKLKSAQNEYYLQCFLHPNDPTTLQPLADQLNKELAETATAIKTPFLQSWINGLGPAGVYVDPYVGTTIPAWSGPDLDGVTEQSSDYAGKIVIMEFWFPQCEWCLDSVKKLNEVKARFADNDRVVILGAQITGTLSDAQNALSTLHARYQSVNVPALADQLKIYGAPQTLILDGQGVIRFDDGGFSANIKSQLIQAIDELVNAN